jgi:hypothetical protein
MDVIKKTFKDKKTQIPEGFRLLSKGEAIQPGDFVTTSVRDYWQEVSGSNVQPSAVKYHIRRLAN